MAVDLSDRRQILSVSILDLDKWGPACVLLLILLVAFGLRLCRLGDQNIWWDEGHAIWAARQNLARVTDITAHDVHPPLYLRMLHVWMRPVGESEFAVRYLSVTGGTLTVALTYVVARRLVGRRAALLATLLIAMARFHIWWSQEARMYIWATFFVLLSTYFMIRLRDGRHMSWWLYVLSSTAALYTLYLSVLALLIQNIFVAATVWRKPRRRRFLFNWILAQLGILLFYVPWLYIALGRTRTDVAQTPFSLRLVWQLYGTVLATGISTHLDRYTWLLALFGLVALAGVALLLFDRRQPQRYGLAGREIGLLLLLPLVLPPLVVFGLSIPRGVAYSPKPEARYLLIFAPLFYILLAGTIATFWQKGRWGRVAAVAVAMLVLGTFVSVLPSHYAGRYLRDEYQTAMATLAAYAEPGDAVLVVSGDRYPLFLYYYSQRFPDPDGQSTSGRPVCYLLPQHSTRFTADNVEGELAPLAEQHPRLWLASLERGLQDPDNVVEMWLNENLVPVLHVQQGDNYRRLYAPQEVEPMVNPAFQPQYAVDRLLDGVRVVGYDLPTAEFRPGDHVNLGFYVRPGTGGGDIGVDWVAADGQVVDRQMLDLPEMAGSGQTARVGASFAVYTYTAPGPYWAEIYSAKSEGDRIRLPTGQVTQSRSLSRPEIVNRQEAWLGDGLVRYLGYRLRPSDRIQAGQTLVADLYWQAQRPLQTEYTVFVHLLGGYNPATGGPVWAQSDSLPLAGGHPTTRWLPAQIVPDRHQVRIPAEMPPGMYQIEAGLYDPATMERLNVVDSAGNHADRILVGEIQVDQ